MPPDMMDKSVATDGDFQGDGEWKRVQLEWLLAALVDSKVVAMKADSGYMKYHAQYHHQKSGLPRHHHHHHCRHKGHSRKSALCKVRQWDDGSAMRGGEERYVTLDMDSEDSDATRRKKKKKRRNVGPMLNRPPLVNKPKIVDPEDLPKRARWTIIITAGFLLLTCMLLVGITLRMAPIIDQMVHNQNEELINSLNRQETDYNETILIA
ncbi:uncharacterized protein LOC106664304 isoform X2 [Cimex lectularius]|uniref:Uncharacterized protein n=1 Tax=Cimex lectularius TaxID=79782 RepID=A0A8I6RL52_CIMLE|nr:uncharacterized protein LOC106664304 isoform X2 [Cimex lectularius]